MDEILSKIARYSFKSYVKFSKKLYNIPLKVTLNRKLREIFFKTEWNFLKNWIKFFKKLNENFLTNNYWNSLKIRMKFS